MEVESIFYVSALVGMFLFFFFLVGSFQVSKFVQSYDWYPRARKIMLVLLAGVAVLTVVSLVFYVTLNLTSLGPVRSSEGGEISGTIVSLHAKDESLGMILRRCADQAGLALALDPKFDDSTIVTLQAQGKLSAVLDNICEVGNCSWQIEPGPQPVLFVRAGKKRSNAR